MLSPPDGLASESPVGGVGRASREWFLNPPHSLTIDDAPAVARAAALAVVTTLQTALALRGRAVLMPSAGRTPMATYALLRKRYKTSLDWSRVICVQMDEYCGIGVSDPRSFASLLHRELIHPLGIGQFLHMSQMQRGSGRTPDQYEQEVRSLGRTDCAIHGLGRNGHIAFNEPGDRFAEASREVELASSTRDANAVAFSHGLTLGLGILAEADTAVVLALGKEKESAAAALLFGGSGLSNPAAALRRCRAVIILLDHAAAPNGLPGRVGTPAVHPS